MIAPPVTTPSEPPSGAFLLASGLAGHGYHAGFLDLSLEFYHRILNDAEIPGPSTTRAESYLRDSQNGYSPGQHRSLTGVIHKRLKGFARRYPGWKLTSMDIGFPGRIHDPEAMKKMIEMRESPFRELWNESLMPYLAKHRPKRILISLAYLSQLVATIDLGRTLEENGYTATLGGSLPRSLASTGHGLLSLEKLFGDIDLGDGMSLISDKESGHLLKQMRWPEIVSDKKYLSARPIVPLTLSIGCFWSRCLFCPDRNLPYFSVPPDSIAEFFGTIPEPVLRERPIIHLLDSAMPPKRLRDFLPLSKQHGLGFYGFARPTRNLLKNRLLEEASQSGLKMLQLGVESGSQNLLDHYRKGLDKNEAEEVIRSAAELGIRTYLYLLFGLPTETAADRSATKEFIAKNSDAIDFLNLSLFNLPRYSELTDRAAEFEVELTDFPRDNGIRLYWPFTYRGRSPRDDARHFLLKTFTPDPAIHPAVLRTPRWFRAAHLALMKLKDRQNP